jgi:pyruvate dehydrogenase E2 component (dihydrolipoamide acetyltransferase)
VIIGTMTAVVPSFKVLPTVRALAKQLQVDLNTVTPTGPKGQITAEDVKRQAKQGRPTTEGRSGQDLKSGEALHGVRRAMAQAMSLAHQEVAQITIMDDADLGHLPADADLTVLLLQAMAAASQAEPGLNAWFDGPSLKRQLFNEVNIGMAMDTPEGLFVPVLKNVGHSSPQALREKINQYKAGVRSRTIAASDMQGATLTLSNFGTIAGKYASPIVVPPTVAILGCGRIYEAAVVRDGKVTTTRILPLSLSADHRAVTGGEAARFLAAILAFLNEKS